jgi:U3 small nucleolar RNA-associated protein 6
MEAMLPELEDLEQRGYFDRSELKQIVQRRQNFEYNLKRKAAIKTDYLRCVSRTQQRNVCMLRKHWEHSPVAPMSPRG